MGFRTYGHSPFRTVVVHGGPGALGDVALLAQELGNSQGVIEPLLDQNTVEKQMLGLKDIILAQAQPPVVLIGHSYGAMLCFLFAAKYPELVKKLIMVSSGVFTDEYATQIAKNRASRLNNQQNMALEDAGRNLKNALTFEQKKKSMTCYGELLQAADSYHLMPHRNNLLDLRPDIYEQVWPQMQAMRSSGELLSAGYDIKCPVLVIHGDYDPRPAEGVRKPLEQALGNFTFKLLSNCGHYPWLEKEARSKFNEDLKNLVHIN